MSLDRLKESLLAVVEALFVKLDYSCLYGATVAAQNSDGTLELKPSTAKLPPLSNVPIRYGIPGVAAKVNQGALVLVGFENADPRLYYALVVSTKDAVQSITLMGGNQPVARVADAMSFFLPPAIPFTGTISGLPAVGVITVLPSPAPGIIIGPGNPKVLA